MPPLHRDPYVARLRRVRPPKPDPKDGPESWLAFGEDTENGVEYRIQTERGALSLLVHRTVHGDEVATLRAFLHTDFAGRKVGLDCVLWSGSVDGQVHGQMGLFRKGDG